MQLHKSVNQFRLQKYKLLFVFLFIIIIFIINFTQAGFYFNAGSKSLKVLKIQTTALSEKGHRHFRVVEAVKRLLQKYAKDRVVQQVLRVEKKYIKKNKTKQRYCGGIGDDNARSQENT